MLNLAVFVVVFIYGFWIWLALAALALLIAFRSRHGRRAGFLACAGVLGLIGAVGGFVAVITSSSQAGFQADARRYFDLACAERAKVELPNPLPEPQVGVRWIHDHDSAANVLSTRETPHHLVAPGLGLYQRVQIVGGMAGELETFAWDDDGALHDAVLKRVQMDEKAFCYSVRTRVVTTARDREFRVEALETTVSDDAGGTVIARRVALGMGAWRDSSPDRVCPGPAMKQGGCAGLTCSVSPFLVAAVPAQEPADRLKAFHLLRGMGRRVMLCSKDLYVGPGIGPADVVWWREGDAVAIAVAGSDDVLICDGFYLVAQDSIRFRATGQAFDISSLRLREGAPDRATPRQLLGSAIPSAVPPAPPRVPL